MRLWSPRASSPCLQTAVLGVSGRLRQTELGGGYGSQWLHRFQSCRGKQQPVFPRSTWQAFGEESSDTVWNRGTPFSQAKADLKGGSGAEGWELGRGNLHIRPLLLQPASASFQSGSLPPALLCWETSTLTGLRAALARGCFSPPTPFPFVCSVFSPVFSFPSLSNTSWEKGLRTHTEGLTSSRRVLGSSRPALLTAELLGIRGTLAGSSSLGVHWERF